VFAERLNLTGHQLDVGLVGIRVTEKYLEVRHDRELARKLRERQRWPLFRWREEVCAAHRSMVREGCDWAVLLLFTCVFVSVHHVFVLLCSPVVDDIAELKHCLTQPLFGVAECGPGLKHIGDQLPLFSVIGGEANL